MKTFFVAILFTTITIACGRDRSPQHYLVVVPDLRRAANAMPQLESWMRDSLTSEAATFRVCAPAADVDGARCTAAITVPTHWGANVLQAKAAFRARSARILTDASNARTAWQFARSVELPHDTVVLAADRMTFPVDVAQWSGGSNAPPRHLMLLCDRSSSIGIADAGTTASLLGLYDRWLVHAAGVGSSLTVLRIGQDLSTTPELFSVQTPGGSRAACFLALLDARARLSALPLDDRNAGSAIAEAVYIAADRLRTRVGEKRLIVLTDGRQFSGLADFDAVIPAPEQFISAMRNAGLAPDLRDVELSLCGFHFGGRRAGAQPLAAATADQARRSVWVAAFAAFGAAPVHVTTRCSDLSMMEDRP